MSKKKKKKIVRISESANESPIVEEISESSVESPNGKGLSESSNESPNGEAPSESANETPNGGVVDPEEVRRAIEALRSLASALRNGLGDTNLKKKKKKKKIRTESDNNGVQ
jgi:hypothetical protein